MLWQRSTRSTEKLLIGAASPKIRFYGEEKVGHVRPDQPPVDECRFEFLKQAPLQQVVAGFYCDHCGIGFAKDSLVRKN